MRKYTNMKNILLLIVIVLTISCSTKRDIALIGYLLAIDTEKSIYQELLNSGKGETVVFYLEHLSDHQIKIHLLEEIGDFASTNRKLFINDKFYPLIFDTDYLFYTKLKANYPAITKEKSLSGQSTVKIPTIEERDRNFKIYGVPKKVLILEYSTYWIVNRQGELIETNVTE